VGFFCILVINFCGFCSDFCRFFEGNLLSFNILTFEDFLRAVTTATAAAVLQMDRKSFDNFLLRIGSDAIPAGRQGVERRITLGLLEELLLAKELNGTIGVPAKDAFAVARRLLGRVPHLDKSEAGTDFIGSLRVGHFIQLGADLASLRTELQQRYEAAVETVVRPQRGRPPRRSSPAQVISDA
jgi:hypothetical protein